MLDWRRRLRLDGGAGLDRGLVQGASLDGEPALALTEEQIDRYSRILTHDRA